MFSNNILICFEGKANMKMIRIAYLDNSTLEFSIYHCICDEMITSNGCISHDSGGSIYYWNHSVRKKFDSKILLHFN